MHHSTDVDRPEDGHRSLQSRKELSLLASTTRIEALLAGMASSPGVFLGNSSPAVSQQGQAK